MWAVMRRVLFICLLGMLTWFYVGCDTSDDLTGPVYKVEESSENGGESSENSD